MIALFCLFLALFASPFKSKSRLEAENAALRHQLIILRPLWGAPRIHGELLKLGFEVAQSSVAKYMVKRCGPPSQGWRTFLRNHAPDIAAMDLFVVPTIGFDLLYVLVIVRLARRNLVWINATPNPTAEWIARQITEAFPWNEAPRYLIRDRDGVYGTLVTRRLRAMGIRDKPIASGSPWQNGFAERLIGSIRRECVDHVVVLGEAHLRRILAKYAAYYNELRTHRSLGKDANGYLQFFKRAVPVNVMGGSEMSDKILNYTERNVASAFEFAQRLAQVRDVPALAQLQTDFIQAQMQAMTEQTKDLSETITKAMMDSLKTPTKGGQSS